MLYTLGNPLWLLNKIKSLNHSKEVNFSTSYIFLINILHTSTQNNPQKWGNSLFPTNREIPRQSSIDKHFTKYTL